AVPEFSVAGKRQKNGLRQPILALLKTAQTAGQFVGQHRNDGADEVGGIAAALGFLVEGRIWLHIGADIRDVDADANVAVLQRLHRKRIVEILGVVWIDGEGEHVAQIV